MASGIDKNTLTIITTNKTGQSDPSTSASDIDSTSTNSQNIIQDSTQSYEAKKELRSRKNRTQSVCISISETIKIKTNNAPIETNQTNECGDFKSNVSSSSRQFPSSYIWPVDKKSAIPILDPIAEETPEDVENFNKAITKTKK